MGGTNFTPTDASGSSNANLTIDPNILKSLTGAQDLFTGDINNLRSAAQTGMGQISSNFAAPKLNTNFALPNPSTGLDAFSKNVVSEGIRSANAARDATNNNIARSFAGAPGARGILQAQNNFVTKTAQNPLLFQAATNQKEREAQDAQLGMQAQGLSNAASIAQAEGQNNATILGNNAASNRAQLAGIPAAASSNLVAILSALAQLTGTKNNSYGGTVTAVPTNQPAVPTGGSVGMGPALGPRYY